MEAQKNRNKTTSGRREIREFRKKVSSLVERGYVAIAPPHVEEIYSGTRISESRLSGENCIGGEAIQQSFSLFDGKQSTPQPVYGCGTDGLGYIPWGPNNRLPNLIYNLVGSLPYTAAAIKYIIDLTTGLGPQLMYRWTRYSNNTVKTELIPFKDAGVLIRGRIMELRNQLEERNQTDGNPKSVVFLDKPQTEEKDELEEIGSLEYELRKMKEDYRVWKQTNEEWEKFCEDNNLGLHYLKCMTDDTHMDIYFPTVGLSIGRKGEEWNPKIVEIGHIPAVCCRMEEMDEQMQMNYVYYSEKWRRDTTLKLEMKDIVAYPALSPERMIPELRKQIARYSNSSPSKRPTWFCCPNYYPSMVKPYYPQPAWWSIFPSRTYDYASTLITDKATARQNATMWGKMIFINNDYLRAMLNEEGADTEDKQKEVRMDLYKRVNDFLHRRENNGKTICLDTFPSADGKTMQRSVEIVDVPQPSIGKEMKDELEELSSIIFFGIGVHPALIGAVPGKSGSSGGTYQRELQLLKQNQVSPRQRIYLRFLQSVYNFNGWDKHGELVVRQQVLTTLDRNATGVEETQSEQ